MNHASARIAPEPTSRAKAAIAALLALFLVLAGALTAPPARALEGATLTATASTTAAGLNVSVAGSGFGEVTATYVAIIEKGTEAALGASDPAIRVAFSGGAFEGTLARAASALDRSKQYEVISWKTQSNPGPDTIYARADLAITSTQWDAVFPPAPATSTTTTLATAPASSGAVGATVTLTATVAPAAAGSVEFFAGAASLGTAPVSGSTAGLSTSTLAEGANALTAVFTPADSAAFTGSTSAAVTFTVTAATPQPAPVTVSVSKTADLARDGETITVTGSGFVANAPATSGSRPPLAGVFGGSYVVFGKFPDAWKPSDGIPSSARKVLVQKWGVHAAQLGGGVTEASGGFVLAADGTFSIDIPVSASEANDALPGNYGIYTYPGSGATYTPFETYTPLSFAAPAPVFEPEIEVFLADGVTPVGDTKVYEGAKLVVKGTGFDPEANVGGMGQPIPATLPQGTFVVFGSFADDWKPSAGNGTATRVMNSAARQWALAESVLNQVPAQNQAIIRNAWAPIAADGSFTATVTVTAPTTPLADGNWGVYTYPGGVNTPANPAQELSVPVAYAGVEPEPEPEPVPTITVTPSTNLDSTVENVLTVTGTGFSRSVYVAIGPDSVWDGVAPWPTVGWTTLTAGIPRGDDGAFTGRLTIPANTLKPGTAYSVSTSVISGAPDASHVVFVPVTVATPPAPVEVELSATSVVAGTEITVSGSGFVENAPATSGTRPPLLAKFAGTYVQFGYYVGSAWTALGSGVEYTKWAVPAADVEAIGGPARGAIALAADGTFTTTVKADAAAAAPAGARYGVRTFAGGGATYSSFSTFTQIEFQAPVVKTIDVSVPSVTADAATVRVVGANFGEVTGAYAAVIEKGTESQLSASGGYVVFGYWMTPGAIVGGAFDKTLAAPADKLDRTKQYEVVVWQGHSAPDATTIYARADITLTPAQWEILKPGTTPPVDPTTPPTTPPTVAGGSLLWAVSPTFNTYVVGPIANGSITVAGGATRSGGLFQFGQAAGSTYDAATGTGTVSYVGSVRYFGHSGVLDVTVANPQIRVTSATSATLYVSSGGSQVAFATLNLAAGAKSTANGAVTYANVPATLTQAGLNQVLSGYGTDLGPVTFTVGAASSAPTGSTGTVASAPAAAQAPAIPATPPTTEGIVLDAATLAALESGQSVSVSASGFQANEQGIRVIVYSTPVLLDTVTADASGTATWSGTLPATLADGEHTLTFQGSADRGIRFTLNRAAATTAIGACVVDGATLNWGFKESFRTYIEGIAAGGWTLTDVTYEYPDYVWASGAGSLDLDTRTGLVTYGGTIRFEGHSGALDTTLSNFRLELAGDVGYIVVDVTGTTQSGEAVAQPGIRFAEFALPDLEITDAGLVLEDLSATLTDAGAAAFGTYAAGEELDAVSAVIPVDTACGEPVAAPAEDKPVAEAKPISAEPVSEGSPVWPWAVGGLAVLVAVGAITWIVVARRRAAAAGGPEDDTL